MAETNKQTNSEIALQSYLFTFQKWDIFLPTCNGTHFTSFGIQNIFKKWYISAVYSHVRQNLKCGKKLQNNKYFTLFLLHSATILPKICSFNTFFVAITKVLVFRPPNTKYVGYFP